MPVVRVAEAPTWNPVAGWLMTGLAAPSRGSQEICVWRIDIDPNTDGPLHRVDREIVLVVVHGTATVVVDGETTSIGSGDAFILPAGSERKLGNLQSEPCELVSTMPVGAKSVRSDGSASFIPWAS